MSIDADNRRLAAIASGRWQEAELLSERILGAGIHKLTVPEYDALPRIRSTGLKTIINKSPKHYRHEEMNKKPPNAGMMLGTATHAALVEPDVYQRDVVVSPLKSKKSDAWEAFVLRHPGKLPIIEKDAEVIDNVVRETLSDPYASRFLVGQPEMSILWTDPITGIECKARADLLDESNPKNPIIAGFKTTRELGPVFDRQIDSFLYQLSWAFYRWGYYCVRGVWPNMIEIVSETQPPFDVAVYSIGEEAIEAGTILYQQALSMIAECRSTGRWPGFGGKGVIPLKLKPWARGMRQEEDFEVMHFPGVGDE